MVDDIAGLRAAVGRIEATQTQMAATQTQMAVSQGTIEGVVSVIKSWGIGIVLAIAAGGVAGVVYLGGEISDLRIEVAKVNFFQKTETSKQLSTLQKSVDQLLKPEKTPSPENKQLPKKPAQKN